MKITRRHWRGILATAALAVATSTGCSSTGGGWHLPKMSWPIAKSPPPPPSTALESHPSSLWKADEDPELEKPTLASMMANGRLQERAGEWDKARVTYENAMKQFPGDAGPYHRLGVVADQQRRYLEAEQLFAEAIRRNPRSAEQFNDLGYCYFLQGQMGRAESAMLKATQLEPKNARFQNNYGMVLAHLGRVDEALGHFRIAGSEADAQYNLAFVFASMDRIDDAKKCFRLALAADGQHEAARRALQSFELYDQLPPEQRDLELAGNNSGQRWVPYREPGEAGAVPPASGNAGGSGVQQAAHFSPANTPRAGAGATRAQYMESRGLLNQNMASQRAPTNGTRQQ